MTIDELKGENEILRGQVEVLKITIKHLIKRKGCVHLKRPDWRFRAYTVDGTEDDFAGYCEDRVIEIALAKIPIWCVIKSFVDMHILTSVYYWKLYFWVKI